VTRAASLEVVGGDTSEIPWWSTAPPRLCCGEQRDADECGPYSKKSRIFLFMGCVSPELGRAAQISSSSSTLPFMCHVCCHRIQPMGENQEEWAPLLHMVSSP
jgi:hypothetical protein